MMIKEDEIMSWNWTLARVVEEHPGRDGIVQAVMVRTAKENYKRTIVKLAPI